MSSQSRDLPRYVPTLTEVVNPAAVTKLRTQIDPEVQAMIEKVQRQIQPVFERRLQEEYERLVRSIVARQWTGISARLQSELEMLVRQAVIDALDGSYPGNLSK